MKKSICIILIVTMSISLMTGCAANNSTPNTAQEQGETQMVGTQWQPQEQTERTQLAQTTYQEVFGEMTLPIGETNPEFADIMNNFIYGDVYNQSDVLDVKQRELITLVSLTTNQSWELLKQHVQGALNVGLTPIEIMETVYHCTPYIGVAKVYDGVLAVNEVFLANKIELPLPSQRQVEDGERLEAGRAIQTEMYGMTHTDSDAPDGHIRPFLSEYCFGDIYTRSGLDHKTRQLLTFSIICNLGIEAQMRSHGNGCVNVGYSKEEIIAAVTQCMPYMGMPRTLAAISIVNEIIPEPAAE